jgi:hypothetical protein
MLKTTQFILVLALVAVAGISDLTFAQQVGSKEVGSRKIVATRPAPFSSTLEGASTQLPDAIAAEFAALIADSDSVAASIRMCELNAPLTNDRPDATFSLCSTCPESGITSDCCSCDRKNRRTSNSVASLNQTRLNETNLDRANLGVAIKINARHLAEMESAKYDSDKCNSDQCQSNCCTSAVCDSETCNTATCQVPKCQNECCSFTWSQETNKYSQQMATLLNVTLQNGTSDDAARKKVIEAAFAMVAESAEAQSRSKLIQLEARHQQELTNLQNSLAIATRESSASAEIKEMLIPIYANLNRTVQKLELLHSATASMKRAVDAMDEQIENQLAAKAPVSSRTIRNPLVYTQPKPAYPTRNHSQPAQQYAPRVYPSNRNENKSWISIPEPNENSETTQLRPVESRSTARISQARSQPISQPKVGERVIDRQPARRAPNTPVANRANLESTNARKQVDLLKREIQMLQRKLETLTESSVRPAGHLEPMFTPDQALLPIYDQ